MGVRAAGVHGAWAPRGVGDRKSGWRLLCGPQVFRGALGHGSLAGGTTGAMRLHGTRQAGFLREHGEAQENFIIESWVERQLPPTNSLGLLLWREENHRLPADGSSCRGGTLQEPMVNVDIGNCSALHMNSGPATKHPCRCSRSHTESSRHKGHASAEKRCTSVTPLSPLLKEFPECVPDLEDPILKGNVRVCSSES